MSIGQGVMGDESGESMEPMEEMPLILGLGGSESERLVRDWRTERNGELVRVMRYSVMR